MRPIVFHLADKHMEEGLRAFFRRNNWHHALGCNRFDIDPGSSEDIFRVAGRADPSIWRNAGTHLKTHLATHEHAVVILDEDFDPYPGAVQIRQEISRDMREKGWADDRFVVVVIEPMLEAWLWADAVSTAKGFNVPSFDELRQQLIADGLWGDGDPKPSEMKRARDRASRIGGRQTGSAIFRDVFTHLSSRGFDACAEPGFQLLRQTLRRWFPAQPIGASA
jgi:FAD/FMN-containing dehydrogenase